MQKQDKSQTLLFSFIADEVRTAWIQNSSNEIKNIQIDYLNQDPNKQSKRGNIYLGTISRVENALNAYFVDYKDDENIIKQGFLPWKETHAGIEANSIFANLEISNKEQNNPNLKVGQKIIFQIVRDERDKKGAALTTFISLPGAFLVLMPNNPEASGVSRKADNAGREKSKQIFNKLNIPANMGAIIRTAGLKCSQEILQQDLNQLISIWKKIQSTASKANELTRVHQEDKGVKKLIRDSLGINTTQIIIDDSFWFKEISSQIKELRPDFNGEIKHYTNKVPLFVHFQAQQQLESIYSRNISLASGGSIVIDRTEALVAIDVNSGRSTKNANIEKTALNTNIEAAKEIAKQLQLRDIGGIIVIDFIDMHNKEDKEQVESVFNQALATDNAKTHTYEISKLGLLEMSRQRLKPSVGDSNLLPCSHCNKRGFVRSPLSFSSSMINILEENAYHAENNILQLQVPTEVANYIWNNKASHIIYLEKKYNIEIVVVANSDYIIPKYQLKRLKKDSEDQEVLAISKSTQEQDLSTHHQSKYNGKKQPKQPATTGLFTKIWQSIFSSNEQNKNKPAKPNKRPPRKSHKPTNQHDKKPPRSNPKNNNRHRRKNNYHRQKPTSKNQTKNNIGITANNEAEAKDEFL